MPDSEARRRWTSENTTHIGIKLNNRTDADILAALDGKGRQTEIKRLIRKGLEAEQHGARAHEDMIDRELNGK